MDVYHSTLQRLSLILIGLCVTIPAFSQNAYENVTTPHAAKVTLSIDKKEIVVGEPVTFGIQMENTGAAPSELASRFYLPEGNDIKIEVQPPTELPFQYGGPLDRGNFPTNTIKLIPGQPTHWSTVLQARPESKSGLLFDVPGRYRISARFNCTIDSADEPVVAELNNATITVKAAEGKSAEAYKILATPAVARAMHLGVIRDDFAREKLTEIVEKYPDTVYGPAAMKALGLSYAYGEKPDHKKAIDLFTKYLTRDPQAPAADWVTYSLAASHHFEKNYEAARESMYYLRQRYPASVYIIQQDPLCQYYLFQPSAATTQIPWLASANRFVAPGSVPPADLKPVPQ